MRTYQFDMRGWLRRFCSRHPLFAMAMVAASSVAWAGWHPWWGVLAVAVASAAGCWIAGWRWGMAWAICGWLAVAGLTWRDGCRRAAERELVNSPGGLLRGKVMKDAQVGARYWSAPVRLMDGGPAGARVWWLGRGEAPVAGAVVTARGNFGPLPEPRNPGEFNRAAWLRSQDIAAVFQAGWEDAVVTGRLAAWGARIRQGFRERVTVGLEDNSQEAAVIRAVVIGETPPDADDLIAAFRNSGTLHVFSVSGLHVAMVGGIGWLVLSGAGMSRRRAVLVLLPLIFGYSWITGHSAPAVRSAWMTAVFLGAFAFRRRPDLLNALGAVLLGAMLWDGRLLFQPGVQLSYGVVAAIAVGVGWASKMFAWMAVPEAYLPARLMSRGQSLWLRARRAVARSLGVSLAAGVGSAPLTAMHFGMVTPVSVLANLVLVPLVFVLLVGGLAAVALSPIRPLACGVNRLNGLVANASVVAAEAFTAIPGGHFRVGGDRRPVLLVYDLEHGAGASCFSGGNAGAVLIDCGDRFSFKRCVMPSLRTLGIEPDSVILSHPDGGHLGGGSAVWQAFPIRQVMVPVAESRSATYQAWLEEGPKAGIRICQAAVPGSMAMPDGARLEILQVPDPLANRGLADDRVMICRLHWHGWKLLFTSDAGMGAEKKLLDTGREIAADVIIAGRHRGDLSLSDGFLDGVNPRAIIASNGQFPETERLPPGAVDYWKSRGIQVIDQRQAGGVSVRVDAAGNLRIEGFLSDSPVVLTPR